MANIAYKNSSYKNHSDKIIFDYEHWQKLTKYNLCMNGEGLKCHLNIDKQIDYFDNTGSKRIIVRRLYEFLDENSNTTLYERFRLLDIPRAFFIHKASELCSDLGWSYDLSSHYKKSRATSFIIDNLGTRNTYDSITHLFKNYNKMVKDEMNTPKDLYYFIDKPGTSHRNYKPINRQMSLIIGLLTKPRDFEVRQKLRKLLASSFSTYLKLSYPKMATYIGKFLSFINSRNETVVCKIKTAFILGIFEPKMPLSMNLLTNMTNTQLVDRWNKEQDHERKIVQKVIDKESMMHGDIVQATFIESYSNLSYKTGALFKWASIYCGNAQFLLKLDVDIYTKFNTLMSLLDNITSSSIESEAILAEDKIVSSEHTSSKNASHSGIRVNHHNESNNGPNGSSNKIKNSTLILDDLLEFQRKFYCRVWIGMPVIREKEHRNFVDVKDFEGDFYPPYCSGWAYLLSPRLAGILYEKSLECCPASFPNEDAFWTGIIPHRTLSLNYTDLIPYYIDGKRDARVYIFRYYSNYIRLLGDKGDDTN
ncbi:unnamed protein product [Gordionus sp. m RMFG-2023]